MIIPMSGRMPGYGFSPYGNFYQPHPGFRVAPHPFRSSARAPHPRMPRPQRPQRPVRPAKRAGCPPGAHHEEHDPSRPGYTCGGKIWNPEIIENKRKPGYNMTGRAIIKPGCRKVGKTQMTHLTDNECWEVTRKVDASNYEVCPPPPGTECVFEDEAGMEGLPKGADKSFAKAFASAFYADTLRHPSLQGEVARGRLGARGLRHLIVTDLERGVKGGPGPALFPSLRAFVKTQMNVEEAKLAGGLSQWAELATAIAGAATSYVNTTVQSKTAESLAKLDLQKQQLALQAAQIQANMTNLQLATTQGAPASAAARAGGGGSLGVPIAIAGGVAVLGGVAYLLLRR